jgi:Putative zinc-finger
MQHTDVDRMAVDRYLLGEMSAAEREEFEQHIFVCRECAEEVKSGAEFFDNARAVFQDEASEMPGRAEAATGRLRRWWDRFTLPVLAPAFAALLLLCLAGYQRLIVIPGLQQQLAQANSPQAIPVFALPSVTRGAEPEIKAPPSSRFGIYFDVATPSSSGYSCEFQDASGAVRLAVPAWPTPEGTIYLELPGSQFRAGEYTLVVRTKGAGSREVGQYPFKLEY